MTCWRRHSHHGASAFAMRRVLLGFLLVLSAAWSRAAGPALLDEAVRKWIDDQDHWAYTQHVCLKKENRVTQNREERFDPSLPEPQQWQLLKVDGKPPTDNQVKTWKKKKE